MGLAHLVEGDKEFAAILQISKVPELVCEQIFHKASLKPLDLWRRKLPLRWEAFAAAICYFLQMFLEAQPGPITVEQYRMMVDAMFAVLEKSFHAKPAFGHASMMPYKATTVHLEHFGAFKVLKHIVDAVPSEAQYMTKKNGVFYATELIKVEGADLDSVRLALGFLDVLLSVSEDPKADAKVVGLLKALERMLYRYRQYPLGTADLQKQGTK